MFPLRGFNREEVLAAPEPLDRKIEAVVRRMVGESIGASSVTLLKTT
jgi:hypothetical protein